MEEKTNKLINILGVIFKIISGLMFLAGIGGLMSFMVIRLLSGGSFPVSDSIFEKSITLKFMFSNFGIMALIQAALAAFLFWASIQFTKLRLWARTVLEMFCWLFILWSVWFGIDIIYTLPSAISLFVRGMFFISSITSAIPFIVLIWFLRKKTLFSAMKNK